MVHFLHVHLILYGGLLHRFVPVGDGVTPPEPIGVEDTSEYMVEHLLQHFWGQYGSL